MAHSFFNDQFVPVVKGALEELRKRGSTFTTIEVIREAASYFQSNLQTEPKKSINANVGRFLKEKRKDFGIELVKLHIREKDDNRNLTHTAVWHFKVQ
jgi:hypothetical protein